MISEEEIAALDPGVRALVVALNAAGYETTDSGDGVSKEHVDGCTIPFLHAFVRVPEHWWSDLYDYTNGLGDWLTTQGYALTVEATYVPGESAYCMVRPVWGQETLDELVRQQPQVAPR